MGPKKKLIVLSSTYPRWKDDFEPGFVHELCRRLTNSFEVTVLCPHSPGAERFSSMDDVNVVRFRYAPQCLETLVNDGGIVSNLKSSPWKWLLLPFFFIAQLISLWKLVRQWGPDVIHAHWIIPQGLAAVVLRFFNSSFPPIYVTSHGADLFALKAGVFQELKKIVLSRAVGISVVSSTMRDEVGRLSVDLDKVTVLPMGVDLENRFRPNLAVERTQWEILFVGRLVEKKGLQYLIQAMPSILEQFEDSVLTVVGFGPEKGRLIELAESLGVQKQVRFVGSVSQSELADFYQKAAVFVAPFIMANNGDQEGLGLVVVEALGCGCPVVVADVPASRDVSSSARGVTVVPVRDSAAIAEAVIEQFRQKDPEYHEVLSSRASLMARFSWEAVARSYSAELNKILSERA
ncbi:MAG: glycosyltransferase [Marinobacter sp.]|nr:glycosyltransferase [Marinobacter sp.]